mgnify:CR=1 FL=1
MEELNVESLEAESYHFRIWKYDQNEEKVTIMQGEENDFTDALDVECSVPMIRGTLRLYRNMVGSQQLKRRCVCDHRRKKKRADAGKT